MVFIAGGIGSAPLRSVIRYVRANRSWHGQVMDIVYGARSRDDLVDYPRLWSSGARRRPRVHLTIDREQPGWDGHVGLRARLCPGAGI